MEQAFKTLDKNRDGVITIEEVEAAVVDASIDEKLAPDVALLKQNFEAILKSRQKQWPQKRDGISLPDFHKWKSGPEGEKRIKRIERESAWAQYLSGDPQKLFGDDEHPVRSITPDAIQQGHIGNCSLMAAIAAVANTKPKLLYDSIKDNGDRTYTVTFAGAPQKPICVKHPTLTELLLYSKPTEKGIWPCIIEKAYGEFVSSMSFQPHYIPSDNTDTTSEFWPEIFGLLTGYQSTMKSLDQIFADDRRKIISRAVLERRAVCAWSKDSCTDYMSCSGVHSNHAYTVLSYNEQTDRITLRNPWGTENAVFSLDFDQFLHDFSEIHYEDWGGSAFVFKLLEGTTLDTKPDDAEVKPTWTYHVIRPLVATFATLVTLILISFPGYCLLFAYQSTTWPTTEGRLIDSNTPTGAQVNQRTPRRQRSCNVPYTYNVAGKDYTSNVLGGMLDYFTSDVDRQSVTKDFTPEGKVTVHYNPNNPSMACLTTRFNFPMTAGFIIIIIVMAHLGWDFGIKLFFISPREWRHTLGG